MAEHTDSAAALCPQLATVDESLFFLALLLLSVLLSYRSALLQREQLACTIAGNAKAAAAVPPVFPLQCAANALVVGSLGYFLVLALQACQTAAEGEDCAARRSAVSNVWAGILVLAAALIRLCDLHAVARCQRALPPEATLPA